MPFTATDSNIQPLPVLHRVQCVSELIKDALALTRRSIHTSVYLQLMTSTCAYDSRVGFLGNYKAFGTMVRGNIVQSYDSVM